jgi:hypothetical protein
MKAIRFFGAVLLLITSAQFSRAQQTVLTWDLATDYTSFTFNTDTVDYAGYISSNVIEKPAARIWTNWEQGSINPIKYIQAEFSPSGSFPEKRIDVTEIQFQGRQDNGFLSPTNLRVAYSLNNDFDSIPSDSVTILNDASISTIPQTYSATFSLPIQVQFDDTLRIRIYAYNAFLTTGGFQIIANTFKVRGFTRDQSEVPLVDNFTFLDGCPTQGSLSWDLPASFDIGLDSVLIFAKKGAPITFGTPSEDPADYGTPETDLSVLNGSVPATLQYENDASAMLVYNGSGTRVDLIEFADGAEYYFMALNVRDAGDGGQKYSDDQTIVGQAFSVLQEVSEVSVLNEVEQITLGWTLPACYDSVMVVVIEGINPTDTFPTGTVNDYLSGISANYSASTSYLNGTDASDGKVVYAGTGSLWLYPVWKTTKTTAF